MSENPMPIQAITNQRPWEDVVQLLVQMIRKIIPVREYPTFSTRRRRELERAHKTIRMAENYGDSYQEIAERIRRESELYRLFKQNPQPIGKVTLRIKRLDCDQASEVQCEVNQPLEGHRDPGEGKASVSYVFQRSPNVVLEFILHDEAHVPLFAIARTYSDWIGCKQFDLGKNRAFYLNMVEESRGYVEVQAGFKSNTASVCTTTRSDTRSSGKIKQVLNMAGAAWPFKKAVLVASTYLILVALGCSMFRVIASTNEPGTQGVAGNAASENAVARTSNPDVIKIYLSSFAVPPNSTSFAESVRCGRELLIKSRNGVGSKAKYSGDAESVKSNCRNAISFVVAFEPVEQDRNNPLLALSNDHLFDDQYKFNYKTVAGQEFAGTPDQLAAMLLKLANSYQNLNFEFRSNRNEAGMTK
jgi:hypothetical protein